MLAQLGHKLLRSAPALDSVVYAAPSREYAGNASVFDPNGKGYFTVGNIAAVMTHKARNLAVCEALAHAYALRPNERPRDPVYGDDFPGLVSGVTCSDFRIEPPAVPRNLAAAVAATAAIALVAAAGVYVAFRSKTEPEPEPRPEPMPSPWRPPLRPPPRPFRYSL